MTPSAWPTCAGPFDEHLRQIELRLGVEIANRGQRVPRHRRSRPPCGRPKACCAACTKRPTRNCSTAHEDPPAAERRQRRPPDRERRLRTAGGHHQGQARHRAAGAAPTRPRYLHAIATHDINFGIGPAGTGKTFLAVASAVEALNESRVQRLLLVRPAVEAGEKLGFLPGDLIAEGRPLPASAVRRAVRNARRREGRQAARAQRHRDRAAGLHARAHAQRCLRDPGRGAEHHASSR